MVDDTDQHATLNLLIDTLVQVLSIRQYNTKTMICIRLKGKATAVNNHNGLYDRSNQTDLSDLTVGLFTYRRAPNTKLESSSLLSFRKLIFLINLNCESNTVIPFCLILQCSCIALLHHVHQCLYHF